MICNKIVDETHLIEPKNKYIVDTNILIYLYGDTELKTENKRNKMLSEKFLHALNIKCKVYIPAIVLSEFINRFHKLEYKRIRRNYTKKCKYDYKNDYRNSEDYKKNNQFILNTIKHTILDRCELISDEFEKSNIEKIMAVEDNQDFNDNLIIDIANRNGLYVISADMDTKKIQIK